MKSIMSATWWLVLLLGLSLQQLSCVEQVTRVTRTTERLLRRQRRYLSFPTGANLVLTIQLVKPIMQVQPRGWNILLECDVPFPLPNDTRIIFSHHDKIIRKRQRRQAHSLLEEALTKAGLDGNSCVKELICDVQNYALASNNDRKSLVSDILSAVFTIPEDKGMNCGNKFGCEIPLFSYIIGSITNTL